MTHTFLIASLFLPTAALAAEPPVAPSPDVATGLSGVEEIVVSATRTPQTLSKIGVSVTVIPDSLLRERQIVVLSDILAQTPGVNVSRNGGVGSATSLRIRGAETDQTLVVVDGVKLNDPSSPGGGFNFADLLAGDTQRIEILRGAQSTLWGSQAIGGVVNIVTAEPTKTLEARAAAEGGSYGTGYGTAAVGGKSDRLSWRLAGDYYTTDGVSAFAGGREPDGYRNGGLSGRGHVVLTDTVSADVRGVYFRSHTAFDGFPPPNFTFADTRDYGTVRTFVGYVGLNADTFGGRLKNRVAYADTDTARRNYNPDQALTPVTFDSLGQNRRWEYQGSAALAPGWTAVFGAETETARMRSASPSAFAPNPTPLFAHATTNSGYGQVQGEIVPGLTLTGGLRHDSHDTFGGHTLGQAAVAWALHDGATVLRASFGQGFKAPTLYELYSPYGNTALRPERADSYDAGIEQHFADNHVVISATGFLRNTTDQIDFVSCFGPGPLCTGRFGYYDNIARTRAAGLEASAAAQAGPLSVQANYTYTDTENRAPGSPYLGRALARRPAHTAYIAATWTWGIPLTTGIDMRYSGRSFDDPANRFALPRYALVGLRANYAISEKLELYGRIENLFDAANQTTLNYGSLGRAAYAGVRAKL